LRLTGVYFDLTDRFAPTPAARRRLSEGGPADETSGDADSRILISVAKRLVPLAVRRNTVKRVVREAWRAAVRNAASLEVTDRQPSEQETSSGSATHSLQSEQANERSGLVAHREMRSRVCLVRLKRHPGSDLTKTRRVLRADVDALFAAFLAGTVSPERGRASGMAGASRSRRVGA
jgi:hypothetical protein